MGVSQLLAIGDAALSRRDWYEGLRIARHVEHRRTQTEHAPWRAVFPSSLLVARQRVRIQPEACQSRPIKSQIHAERGATFPAVRASKPVFEQSVYLMA